MKRFVTTFGLIVTLLVSMSSPVLGQHFEPPDEGVNHSIMIIAAEINGESLVPDDEIGVFTPDGVCAGATIIPDEDPPWGVTAFADDYNTDDVVEGFLVGEPFSFRFWDHANEVEEEFHIQYDMGDRVFRDNGFTRIALLFWFAEPVPVIDLSDYEYDFGLMGVDHTREWTLTITNIGFEALTIEDVTLDNQVFAADFEGDEIVLEVDESHDMLVTFTPDEAGAEEGTLTIINDDPNHGEVDVSLFGTGTNTLEPDIVFNYDEIDFGEWPVVRRMVKEFILTITNEGTGDLTISDATVEGAEVFGVEWDADVELAPYESYELTVTFLPEEVDADYEGTLIITSDDPDDEEARLDLLGTGVEPRGHFNWVRSDNGHQLLIQTALLNGEVLDANDEIGVFTPGDPEDDDDNPICAGSGTLISRGERVGFTAWAYEPQTQTPGFRDADVISYRFWDASAEIEYAAESRYIHGPDVFRSGSYSVLHLTAESPEEPQIDVSPTAINFGEVGVTLSRERSIRIRNNGGAALRVTNIASDDADIFPVDFEVGFILEPNSARVVTVSFEPQEVQEYTGQLEITSNSPGQETVTVDLAGTGVAVAIRVSDRSHDFERVVVDQTATWELTISNIGGEDLTIDSLRVDDDVFAHDFGDEAVVLEPEAEVTVEVTFTPDEETDYESILTIYNDDPNEDNQALEITLTGEGWIPGDIRLSRTLVEFGEVDFLEDETFDAIIFNDGEGDLHVTDMTITGDEVFSMDFDGDFVLEPDGEYVLSIAFEPEAAEAYEAEIHIFSDDPDESDVRIRLRGSGIYVNHNPEVDNPIEDLTLDEDFEPFMVANLDEVFSDPNGEELYYEADSPLGAVNVGVLNGNQLWLDTDEDWNGNATITVTASDEGNRDLGPTRNLRRTNSENPTNTRASRTTLNRWGINDPRRDLEAEDEFNIEVRAVPDDPYWVTEFADIEADEDEAIEFTVEGYDGDDEDLTIVAESDDLPEGWDFTDIGDGTGDFTWTPSFEDAGEYTITFTLSDGTTDVPAELGITILDVNRPPVWEYIPDEIEVEEGDLIEGTISGSDPDGDDVTIDYFSEDLPEDVEFTDNGDGTADIAWQTDFEDAGEYTAIFTISDFEYDVEHTVSVIVQNVNRAPQWDYVPEDQVVEIETDEEETIAFTVRGSDPDDEELTIDYSSANIPEAAGFTDNGDGTGDFSWTITIDDAGNYTATFTLSDGDLEAVADVEITIIGLNQPPEWVEVNDAGEWLDHLRVDENETLEFTVHGTDPDEDDIADLAISVTIDGGELPEGCTFEDQGQGYGLFSWQTDYLDAGDYTATFTLNDAFYDVEADIEITVDNVNRAPAWYDIPAEPIVVDEAQQIQFTVRGRDPDADDELTITYDSENLPEAVVLDDHGDGTATFTWDTDYLSAGEYTMTFTISDGIEEVASDEVTLRVNNRNAPPVWVDMPEEIRVQEGDLINEVFTAVDVDEDDLTLTYSSDDLPDDVNFTDNGDGTGSFTWDTDALDAGEYTATLTASDEEFDVAVNIAIIVSDVNQPPEWTEITDRVTIDENDLLEITVEGEDIDGDDVTITYDSEDIPEDAEFEDHGDGTATLTWQTDYLDAGSYEVTFTISDYEFDTPHLVRITVLDVNRAPVWDEDPGDIEANEDDLIEFSVSGSDPDNNDLTITYSTFDLPEAVDFVDNGDGSGDFSWQTTFEDGGDYTATFTLSDGDLSVDVDVNIAVGNVNHAPEWTEVPVPQRAEDEGDLVQFDVAGEDVDGDDLAITYTPDENLPDDVFTDHGDGSGTFEWQTGDGDEGGYTATFTLSDGGLAVDAEVIITVGNVNQPPEYTQIPGHLRINENSPVSFTIITTDPEDDYLTIEYASDNLPEAAEFVDNHDNTGDFSWQPTFDDAGTYVATFTLSDDEWEIVRDVTITVNNVNRAPTWSVNMPPRSITGAENSHIQFNVRGNDPDGDDVTISYSSEDLPLGAEFTDNGDGSGTFSWQTDYDDAGRYEANFTLSDDVYSVAGLTTIRVTNVNREPVWIDPQDEVIADEGDMVTFVMRGTDPDGIEDLDIVFDQDGLPDAADFTYHGEGWGSFTWQTNYDDMGEYTATFILTDGDFEVEHVVPITIEYVNRSPFWVFVPPEVTGDENEWIAFNVSGDDPDDDDQLSVAYQSDDLPEEVTFTDNEDGTGTFYWRPTYDDAGEYTATFTLSDNNGLEVTESVSVTVVHVNRAPGWVEAPILVTLNEVEVLELEVSGSDPDGDDLSISYASENLPEEAEFTDNGDGSGVLAWTPTYDDAGRYQATFTLSDGEFEVAYTATIEVNHVNRAPGFDVIDPDVVEADEDDWVVISIEGSDPDDDDLSIAYFSADLPNAVQFSDNGDGTANLTWHTGFEDAGEYTARFTISDGELSASAEVSITVLQVNLEPYWVNVPDDIVSPERRQISFIIQGTDPDEDDDLTIEYTSDDLPDNITFIDYRNGNCRFSWTPSIEEAGEYTATFTLSDGEYEDVAEVDITVTNVNRDPVWDDDPQAAAGDEGELLEFTVSSNDPDEDALSITFTARDLIEEAAEFTDNGDGTADFGWTPTFEDAGEYIVTFTLSDGESSVDKDVTITVSDVNRAPYWVNVPQESIVRDETQMVRFVVTSHDPDGDGLTIDAQSDNLPEAAEFTDEGDGTGSFAWQTTFDDVGEYSITLTLSDGVLTDEVTVNIVVNNINRSPEWVSVPATVDGMEGNLLRVWVVGEDLDNDNLTIEFSSDNLPEEAEFTDNGDGTGVLAWTPDFGDAGAYAATFVISDGELSDEAEVAIEIEHRNRIPYWIEIPDVVTVNESVGYVSFFVIAGDSDGVDLEITYDPSDLPEDDEFTLAHLSADTAMFQWVIDYETSGSYTVWFSVSDGEDSITEDVIINIIDTSRPPEWVEESIPSDDDLHIDETDTLQFTLTAFDPDGDNVTMRYESDDLPEEARFRFNGRNEDEEVWTGTFTWTTNNDDAGEYTALFIISDGESDVELELDIVVDNVNREPFWVEMPELVEVNDNELIEFDVRVEDPDGDDLYLVLSGLSNLPEDADYDFEDHEDGSGTFTWETGYDFTGQHSATFLARDPEAMIRSTVDIIINNVNRAPAWVEESLPEDSLAMAETDTIAFTLEATDPDGRAPRISYASDNLPDAVSFSDNRDGTADFLWITTLEDAGEYSAIFTAFDAEAEVDFEIYINVDNVNRATELTDPIPDFEFTEDDEERLVFNVYDHFADPDEDDAVSFEVTQEPELVNYRLTQMGDFFIQPLSDLSGIAEFIISATDNIAAAVLDTFLVTIEAINDPAEPNENFDNEFPDGAREMEEDTELTTDLDDLFDDPEGDSLIFDFEGGEHLGIGLDDENVLTLNPDDDWFGVEPFTLIVTDLNGGNGAPRRDDEVRVQITVTVTPVVDDPPQVVNPIADLELVEDFVDTTVAVLDDVFNEPDGQDMVYTVQADDPLFAWIDYETRLHLRVTEENFFGVDLNVNLTATDESDLVTAHQFTVDVIGVDDPPEIINEIDDREYDEDTGPWAIIDLDSVFFDPDGVEDLYYETQVSDDNVICLIAEVTNVLTLEVPDNFNAMDVVVDVTCSDTPPAATTSSRYGRSVSGADLEKGPVRQIRSASEYSFGHNWNEGRRDDEVTDSFIINIMPVNDSPAWAADIPTDVSEDEANAVSFIISAEDPDGATNSDILTLGMVDDGGTAALGALFTDNGDGSGDYTWQTDYTHAGDYTVVFQVADLENVTLLHSVNITIGNVNRAPSVISPISDLVFDEGELTGGITIANLDTVFADPDTDDIVAYQIGVFAEPWRLWLEGSLLMLAVPENYNSPGYQFIVSAADNEAADADTFSVTINSINDPPTDFSLIEPVNFYTVINPWVVFKWEASMDVVEDSAMVYTLIVSFDDTTHEALAYGGLSDTELIIRRMDLYKIVDDIVVADDTTYADWWVIATDGIDAVRSIQTLRLIIPPLAGPEPPPELPPTSLKLGPVYPNPFNDRTTIEYDLPWDGFVEIAVYDLAGRVVYTLVSEEKVVGRYVTYWDGTYYLTGKRAASGLYLCRLQIKDDERMVQIILLR